ncbi:MAG: hypothetical protein R2772_07770 [Chitinophagales bacterium]
MKKLLSFTFLFLTIGFLQAQLSGSYTVDLRLPTKKSNFNNLTEAINALQFKGIDGDVVFEIKSGDYYEPLVFEGIDNDLNFSVTFKAEQDGKVNFINDGLGLLVSNSSNMIFTNLSFNSTSTELSSIAILSNSSNIILESNEFIASEISETHKSVISLTTTSDNNIINANKIIGASGIELARMSNENFISSNEIFFQNKGIEVLSSVDNTLFSNTISGHGDLGNIGIQLDGYGGTVNIASNAIGNTKVGLTQALTYRPSDKKLSGKIVNNVIVSEENTIELTNNIFELKIAFNSFTSNNGTVISAVEALKGSITDIDVFANNLLNQSEKPIIYANSKAIFGNVDYNNLYNVEGNFYTSVNGTESRSIEEWKYNMASNHTISADPEYVALDSKKYLLSDKSPCIDAGPKTNNIGVLTDFDGDLRDEKTEIGADEFNKTSYENMLLRINLAME